MINKAHANFRFAPLPSIKALISEGFEVGPKAIQSSGFSGLWKINHGINSIEYSQFIGMV